MISLELARQLMEAGLEWEPKTQDVFYFNKLMEWHPSFIRGNIDIEAAQYENWVFAPTLSQILGEIEARGWDWSIAKDVDAANGYSCMIIHEESCLDYQTFWEDTPEAAAAAALIWILREGKE